MRLLLFTALLIIGCTSTGANENSSNHSGPDTDTDTDTDTDADPIVRVPAEWEPQAATWMQWPANWEQYQRPDFAKIIDVIQNYQPVHLLVLSNNMKNTAQQFLKNFGVPLTNITWHVVPYDSSWLRDNGPIYVEGEGGLRIQDWGFDAWGGNFGANIPFANDDAVPSKIADLVGLPVDVYDDYILERGNLEFNGSDTLILNWDCQLDRNPEWSKEETEALFEERFGVSQVIWTEGHFAEDGTTGHIDGVARFIDENTVAVVDSQGVTVYEDAAQVISDAGFDVVRVAIPGSVTYNGVEMEAVYMNWLVINEAVIVNGFGNPQWDKQAKETIEGFFPRRDVHVIDTRNLWYYGGAIHCVTNDQPQ